MACKDFAVSTVKDVVKETLRFLTDENVFGEGKAWQLMDIESPDKFIDRCIIKGVGNGEEEIYVGIMIRQGGWNNDMPGQTDIRFNGYSAYDDGLTWYEQPGNIYHDKLPTMPLPEQTRLQCWVTANTRRFILVTQASTQYEACYCGLFKAMSIERQYPYPLAIGGSACDGQDWTAVNDNHSMWTNPGGSGDNTTLRVRRPDGMWESGLNKNADPVKGTLCIWPQITKPTKLLTALDNNLTVENVIMFPMLMYECANGKHDPVGIIGEYDGVFFIGNREDISSKDTLVYKDKPYIVFNNVNRRDNDEYWAMEWF